LISASGCATVTSGGGGDQTVRITSVPAGAEVVVNGLPTGQTPLDLSLSRGSNHAVELIAEGYHPARVQIVRKFNPWLLGNLILGGPVGLIVDVVTDSTHWLTPGEVEVHLAPVAPPPTLPATPPATSD
jgi:hypothetical protein